MADQMRSRVRNDAFLPSRGFDRGASQFVFASWYLFKCVFFLSPVPWPPLLRNRLLRLFGAKIGKAVYLKPRVNIQFPWKLSIGDHTWIGEQVDIYNFEPVSIGSNCCLSQRTFFCAANHDYSDPAMSYRNAPIILEDGVWIGACCFVGPGVTLGFDCVVTAGSVVTKSLPPEMVCVGNPCVPIKSRWTKSRHPAGNHGS
jgi:putative colanic acid biosynthesis acetyltransferase WcaF